MTAFQIFGVQLLLGRLSLSCLVGFKAPLDGLFQLFVKFCHWYSGNLVSFLIHKDTDNGHERAMSGWRFLKNPFDSVTQHRSTICFDRLGREMVGFITDPRVADQGVCDVSIIRVCDF